MARFNTGPAGTFVIRHSVRLEPFGKKEVRQALNYAIDRKRYSESILLKTGEPAVLPWAPSSPGYDASCQKPTIEVIDRAGRRSISRA